MKMIIALLPLFLFAGMVQSNGPYYEWDEVYIDPAREMLALSSDSKHVSEQLLWKPFHVDCSQAKPLPQKTASWDGTTLICIDGERMFLAHYFHFLEHLIGIWQFGGAEQAKDVKQIVLCPKDEPNLKVPWHGKNKINRKLIKSLFPNAKVYSLVQLKDKFKKGIRCKKSIISSPDYSFVFDSVASINKMLGASWKEIDPAKLEKLRTTVLSSLGVYSNPSKQLRITYSTRPKPRTLTPNMEKELLAAIEEKTGVKVNVVDFAAIPFEEQLRIAANTDVLLSVHGNGLSHIIFLPPTATVFEFFPKTGFTWDYALFAKLRRLDYHGYHASDWVTSQEDPHRSRFYTHGDMNQPIDQLDLDTIVQVINKLKSSIRVH
jgi:hypothetical protein